MSSRVLNGLCQSQNLRLQHGPAYWASVFFFVHFLKPQAGISHVIAISVIGHQ